MKRQIPQGGPTKINDFTSWSTRTGYFSKAANERKRPKILPLQLMRQRLATFKHFSRFSMPVWKWIHVKLSKQPWHLKNNDTKVAHPRLMDLSVYPCLLPKTTPSPIPSSPFLDMASTQDTSELGKSKKYTLYEST